MIARLRFASSPARLELPLLDPQVARRLSLIALVLRILVKRTDAVVLRDLWPGPDRSLFVVFRLAGVRVAAP